MSSRKDEHLPALAGNTVSFLRMPVLLRLRYRFRKALSALLPSRAPRRYLYTEIIESDKGADRIPVRRAYSMNLKALMADFSPEELVRMAERGDAPPPQLTVTFSAYFRSGAVISGATGICADEATGAALASTVRPAVHLLPGRAEPPAEKLRPLRGDEHTFYIPPPPPALGNADRFRLFFCEYLPELHLCLTEALRKDTPACLIMRDDAPPYEEDVYAALALKFPALSFLRLKDSEALHAPKALLPCYRTKGKAEPYLSRGYRNFLNDLLTSHFRMPPAPRRIGGQSGPRARPVRVFLRFDESDEVALPKVNPALPKARPYCLKEMRLSDLVALMRRTVHLQAPHGAGLAAALFLSEGARVTEILNDEGGGCAYWWMCKVFGLRYDTALVEEEADLTANLWSASEEDFPPETASISDAKTAATPPASTDKAPAPEASTAPDATEDDTLDLTQFALEPNTEKVTTEELNTETPPAVAQALPLKEEKPPALPDLDANLNANPDPSVPPADTAPALDVAPPLPATPVLDAAPIKQGDASDDVASAATSERPEAEPLSITEARAPDPLPPSFTLPDVPAEPSNEDVLPAAREAAHAPSEPAPLVIINAESSR